MTRRELAERCFSAVQDRGRASSVQKSSHVIKYEERYGWTRGKSTGFHLKSLSSGREVSKESCTLDETARRSREFVDVPRWTGRTSKFAVY